MFVYGLSESMHFSGISAVNVILIISSFVVMQDSFVKAFHNNLHVPSQEERMRKEHATQHRERIPEVNDLAGKFHMHYCGPEEDAVRLGEKHGFKFEKKIMKDHFEFSRDDVEQFSTKSMSLKTNDMFDEDSGFQGIEQVKVIRPTKYSELVLDEGTVAETNRSQDTELSGADLNITDAMWDKQWHLHVNVTPSMRVYEAWQMGYTGKGVVVAFLDDGIDPKHPDLVENYDASLSFDYNYDLPGGVHMDNYDWHGTQTAGIIAAVKNNVCVIGTAYEATLASLRILDSSTLISYAMIARAFTHKMDAVHISSNSWGLAGAGSDFYELSALEKEAIELGVKEGRNGKGIIYVFASGNDGLYRDDCNAEGHVTNVNSIAVGAMGVNGPANYGEQCTCIMVAAYGGEETDEVFRYLMTTMTRNRCMDNFLGTSAAAPIVSGVMALALEANPELTWRDVKHLVVETSTSTGLPNSPFKTNGAGKNVSLNLGFGVINAEKMVSAAESWKTVPDVIQCTSRIFEPNKCCTASVEDIYNFEGCHIRYLENVEVRVHMKAYWREYTELHLISPDGTDSRLLRQRRLDTDAGDITWTFMTVHSWGENPIGNWTLRIDSFMNHFLYLYKWKLILHGTATNPLQGKPPDGEEGGHCSETIPCQPRFQCLLHYNICVDCTIPDYRLLDGFCVKDGEIGGFCDVSDNITCADPQTWCNETLSTCQRCSFNYHVIDEYCIKDGTIGGYCDPATPCLTNDTGCDEETHICIPCTDGYRPMDDGLCKQDGKLFGYCDEKIPCSVTQNIACLPMRNLCINCNLWDLTHVIDGFCITVLTQCLSVQLTETEVADMYADDHIVAYRKTCDIELFIDRTLGGYCDSKSRCVDKGVACDKKSNRCVNCTAPGFRENYAFCMQDGAIGGYCSENVTCMSGAACDLERKTCENCSMPDFRVLQDGSCKQDGIIGGFCDDNVTCIPIGSGCSPTNNTCIMCFAGSQLIDGFCFEASTESSSEALGGESEPQKLYKLIIAAAVGLTTGVIGMILFFLAFNNKCCSSKQANSICCNGSNDLSDTHRKGGTVYNEADVTPDIM